MVEFVAKRRIISTSMMTLCGNEYQLLLQTGYGSRQWYKPHLKEPSEIVDLSAVLAVPNTIPLCIIRYLVWQHGGINETNELTINMLVDIDGTPHGGNHITRDTSQWHTNSSKIGPMFLSVEYTFECLLPKTQNVILEDLKSKHVLTAIPEILRRHFTT